ncbi:MAG: hypothetical protein KJZ47_03150 [Gemmatimonadales bacterium]|nr:hypothetical protein [Gemmatimonadales bacterium]
MSRLRPLAGLALALTLSACSDGSGPSDGNASVAFYIGTGTGAALSASSAITSVQAVETIDLGPNTIVIDEVQLVLRKLALQRQVGEDNCDDETEEATESSAEDAADDGQSCSVLKMGPILVDLPLDGSTVRAFTIDAEPGTFRRMMFQLHKPSDDEGDAAFLVDHPEFAGASLRVAGTFDGEAFEYTTDLTVVQHLNLDPPLEIAAAGQTELTLNVDISTWFRNAAGTGLIDPAAAAGSGQLESRIRQNIRNSFRGRRGHDPD